MALVGIESGIPLQLISRQTACIGEVKAAGIPQLRLLVE